jgi:lysophospholipase L1-like esterase
MARARSVRWLLVGAAAIVLLAAVPGRVHAEPGRALFTPTEIEDASGRGLDRFFASLRKTAARRPGAVTRIAHYGDSVIVGDLITRHLRKLFQERYGDAGPGFVLAGMPWDWYRHAGMRIGASAGWQTYRGISGGPPDHRYGYGGVTFVTRSTGEHVWITTEDDEGRALKASIIDVHYLAQPEGGDIDVLVDGEHVLTLSTSADSGSSAFHAVRVPDGGHRIELRTAGNGEVRLFGVALEREGPGVVYDSLGVNNACTTMLGRIDADHLGEQLGHRRPDLIVLTFGANESNRPGLVARYRTAVLPAVRQLRRASHGASCLIMAPMDRGMRHDGGEAEPNALIPTIVEAQRGIARDTGCAFFDTFAGMGGSGSMRRWVAAGLAGGDMVHPTKEGGALIGRELFEAVERAFDRYREAH